MMAKVPLVAYTAELTGATGLASVLLFSFDLVEVL